MVVVSWDDFDNDSLFLARGDDCGVNEHFFLGEGARVGKLSGPPSEKNI